MNRAKKLEEKYLELVAEIHAELEEKIKAVPAFTRDQDLLLDNMVCLRTLDLADQFIRGVMFQTGRQGEVIPVCISGLHPQATYIRPLPLDYLDIPAMLLILEQLEAGQYKIQPVGIVS